MARLEELTRRAAARRMDAGVRLAPAALDRAGGPGATKEFLRIAALPVRRPAEPDEALRVGMTAALRSPGSTVELRDAQARALSEIRLLGGGLCALGVGAGKTLTAILAATVLRRFGRAAIICPAGLRENFKAAIYAARRDGWQVEQGLENRVMGYEELSRPDGEKRFRALAPSVVIADECHFLRRLSSARTRRFLRFFKDFPITRFVGLSGTIVKNDLTDFWHLVRLALGEERSPLPRGWPELQSWQLASAPGSALASGLLPELGDPGDQAAEAVGKRIRRTPGVVSTRAASSDASLVISVLSPRLPDVLSGAIERVEREWEIPDGPVFADRLAIDRAVSQLTQGFWTELQFPAGSDATGWRETRRRWASFCRSALVRPSLSVDTELGVRRLVQAGLPDGGALAEWETFRRTVMPKPRVVWLDRAWLPALVKAWLGREDGLVWSHWIPGAVLTTEALGLPFFGAGDDPETSRPRAAVLTIGAHGRGRNLQFANRNLVLSVGPDAGEWQQLVGRTHRAGQQADTVEVAILAPTETAKAKLAKAREGAAWLERQTGEPQKLRLAEWIES